MVVARVELLEPQLVFLEAVEGSVDVGVDPHDQACVNLYLLQLLTEGLVPILTEPIRKVREPFGEQLPTLVSL